jgi:NDP-sugar pyrophosphorylase family protein
MSDPISLDSFVDLRALLHGARLVDRNPFAYVGKAAGAWVEALLDELDVRDTPVVKGHVHAGATLVGRVYVAEGAEVEPTAFVQGPTYIGPGAEIRHGAYVRGQVYVGPKAVVGHASEVKGSVLLDGAKAAHFAYVGDSVLGRDVNLGAGTKLANLMLARRTIRVVHPVTGALVSTGLTKFGAVMGDHAQTGCNAVLNPGTLMLPKTAVLACLSYRGTLTAGLYKG